MSLDQNIVSQFVGSLTEQERRIAFECIRIPNNPNIGPEVLKLTLLYGNELNEVTDKIEELRKQTGCTYNILQEKLRPLLRRN